ncbi:hypothetical protein CRG98_016864 [Punica granatum]|uniref:Uncharacterized protein n=1 Tax=Punica granatum TaxID=22663 RepID=A0A2I0K2J2_PUNGR|nr:hypothetical protein CRG98_016864 [Punica granatum]
MSSSAFVALVSSFEGLVSPSFRSSCFGFLMHSQFIFQSNMKAITSATNTYTHIPAGMAVESELSCGGEVATKVFWSAFNCDGWGPTN